MSDITHFIIVAIISVIAAGIALKILQRGLQGTPKQFYWNFLGGLISIGVLSVIVSAVYMLTLSDQARIQELCSVTPNDPYCLDLRSKLQIPLFSGVGGMLLFFGGALTSRVSFVKKSGIQ